jgi:hypothetical protein
VLQFVFCVAGLRVGCSFNADIPAMRAADHQLAVDGFTGKYGSVREVVQVDFSIFRRSLLKFDFMKPVPREISISFGM